MGRDDYHGHQFIALRYGHALRQERDAMPPICVEHTFARARIVTISVKPLHGLLIMFGYGQVLQEETYRLCKTVSAAYWFFGISKVIYHHFGALGDLNQLQEEEPTSKFASYFSHSCPPVPNSYVIAHD